MILSPSCCPAAGGNTHGHKIPKAKKLPPWEMLLLGYINATPGLQHLACKVNPPLISYFLTPSGSSYVDFDEKVTDPPKSNES